MRKCLARSRGCRNFVGVSTLLSQHFQPITANSSSQRFVARQPSRWRPAQPRPPAAPCRRGLPPPRPSAWMGRYRQAPRSAKSAATRSPSFCRCTPGSAANAQRRYKLTLARSTRTYRARPRMHPRAFFPCIQSTKEIAPQKLGAGCWMDTGHLRGWIQGDAT